ncbi:MAG: hypothetical protein ACI4SP_04740 [Eubacteriales bacterium]
MTKRIVFFLLAVLLLSATVLPCFASENITPDFKERPSPTICVKDQENSSGPFVGVYYNDNSDTPYFVREGGIQLVSYAERATATEMVRNALQTAYASIAHATYLGELNPKLDDEAHYRDASFSSVVFVASDLFYISLVDVTASSLMTQDKANLVVAFSYDLPENNLPLYAMCQDPVEKTWHLLDNSRVRTDIDGELTIVFDRLAPTVILRMDPTRLENRADIPDAGWIWVCVIIVLVAVLGGAAALITVTHIREKKKSQGENAAVSDDADTPEGKDE